MDTPIGGQAVLDGVMMRARPRRGQAGTVPGVGFQSLRTREVALPSGSGVRSARVA